MLSTCRWYHSNYYDSVTDAPIICFSADSLLLWLYNFDVNVHVCACDQVSLPKLSNVSDYYNIILHDISLNAFYSLGVMSYVQYFVRKCHLLLLFNQRFALVKTTVSAPQGIMHETMTKCVIPWRV